MVYIDKAEISDKIMTTIDAFHSDYDMIFGNLYCLPISLGSIATSKYVLSLKPHVFKEELAAELLIFDLFNFYASV